MLLCAGVLSAQTAVKDQVLTIPVGTLVQVKLKDKRTLVGRMGAATDQSFTVQYAKNDKIVDEKVAFQDVKSVKPKAHGMRTGVKVGIGAAIGAGGLLVFILILSYLS